MRNLQSVFFKFATVGTVGMLGVGVLICITNA